LRRLKTYKGYQPSGKDPKVEHIFFTKFYHELEEFLHHRTEDYGLDRKGNLELFVCKNKKKFMKYIVAEGECFIEDLE
jgi:hypothetical protein